MKLFDKLSKEAKVALSEMDWEVPTDFDESVYVAHFVSMATNLYKNNYIKAATVLDGMVEEICDVLKDPKRVVAKVVRQKMAQKKEYYTRDEIESLLATKWDILTDEFKNKVRNMRTVFDKLELNRIVQRWIDTGFGTKKD
jgi:hypothetical protein